MPTLNDLQKRLIELQNEYQTSILSRKDFSDLKAIKNNIKKVHTAMHVFEQGN